MKSFKALLALQGEPRTLRQIGESLALPPDGTKVNGTLRAIAAKTAIIRRWAIKEPGKTTVYWMPPDRRPDAFQQSLSPSDAEKDEELTLLSLQEVSRVNQGLNGGEKPSDGLQEGLTKAPKTSHRGEGPLSERPDRNLLANRPR